MPRQFLQLFRLTLAFSLIAAAPGLAGASSNAPNQPPNSRVVAPHATLVVHGKTIVVYHLPATLYPPIAAGNNDDFWFTSGIGSIQDLQLASMKVTTFPIPPSRQGRKFNEISGIAYDPATSLAWFTTRGTMFGSVNRSGHVATYRGPENSETFLGAMTKGPDGRIWFTIDDRNKGGALEATTSRGKVTSYPLPDSLSRPCAVTTGPDGQMWTYDGEPEIAKVTTAGVVTTYPLNPSLGDGSGCSLAAGSDGDVWFLYDGFRPPVFEIGKIAPNGSVQHTIHCRCRASLNSCRHLMVIYILASVLDQERTAGSDRLRPPDKLRCIRSRIPMAVSMRSPSRLTAGAYGPLVTPARRSS